MRIIAHIDMDAFFAAVEEREKPWLKGSAVVVGSDPDRGRGRGVVATANYKARRFGIHSAMPIRTAWFLSEEARLKSGERTFFVVPNFRRYGEVSERVMDILRQFSSFVEVASVDEAYLDLSYTGSFTKAFALATEIKKKILERERLTASVGVGPNKMIAKIAAGFKKPDGLLMVTSEEVLEFLSPLPVEVLPGVGRVTEKRLRRMRIDTIKDLRSFSPARLQRIFGKHGLALSHRALGIDESPISFGEAPKSIGEQETFLEDVSTSTPVVELVTAACEKVFRKMQEEGFASFRTVAIVVRFADFETKTRAHTLREPCSNEETLVREALQLLLPFFDKRENPMGKTIRLAGVRIEKFTHLEIKPPSLGLKDKDGNEY